MEGGAEEKRERSEERGMGEGRQTERKEKREKRGKALGEGKNFFFFKK